MANVGEPAGHTTTTETQGLQPGALKTAGTNQLLQTLRGDYFADDNTQLNNMLEAQVRRLAPQVNAQFGARGGSLGSPLAQNAIARTITDSGALLYDNERDRQIRALGAVPPFAGALGTSEEPYFDNSLLQILGGAGAVGSLLGKDGIKDLASGAGGFLKSLFGGGGGGFDFGLNDFSGLDLAGGGGLGDSSVFDLPDFPTPGAADISNIVGLDGGFDFGGAGVDFTGLPGIGGGGVDPGTAGGLFDLGSLDPAGEMLGQIGSQGGNSALSGGTGLDSLFDFSGAGADLFGGNLTGIDAAVHAGDTGIGGSGFFDSLFGGDGGLSNLFGGDLTSFLNGPGGAMLGAAAPFALYAASPYLAEAALGPQESYDRNEVTGTVADGQVLSGGSPEMQNFARNFGLAGNYPVVQSDWHGEGFGIDVNGTMLYSGLSAQSSAQRAQERGFGESSGPQFMGMYGDEAGAKLLSKVMNQPGAQSAIRRISQRRAKNDAAGRPMVTVGELAAELGVLDQIAPTQKTKMLLGQFRASNEDEGA